MRGRGERRVWAAMLFPIGAEQTVIGAVRGSRRLHWTARAARAEAQQWLAEFGIEHISWEAVDDEVIIGRNRTHALVLRSVLLPQGPPPADR